MQRPFSHVLVTQRSPERKAASFVAVGALHVGLIAALMAGLTPIVVKNIPHDVTVFFTPEVTPPPAPPAPPKFALAQPLTDTMPPPVWDTKDKPDNQIAVAHNENPPPVDNHPIRTVLPTPVISLIGSHTTPPYPPLSRRLGEEGRVSLHILVAADGRVTDVTIAKSSGVQRLDEAARDWVRANWLYRPATKDGMPIGSQTDAVVVFNLKTAR